MKDELKRLYHSHKRKRALLPDPHLMPIFQGKIVKLYEEVLNVDGIEVTIATDSEEKLLEMKEKLLQRGGESDGEVQDN